MIQSTRTFRVFVSSTFSDLKAERNALQERVFPELRKLCEEHGCRFQAIDLRWGVSEEAALDQQAMHICLEEVDRCQKLSPRPNFIVLLGDRYGWQPAPYEIPSAEYDSLVQHISPDENDLLNAWYKRDDNAVPQVYCLQPREDEHEEFGKWEPIEKKLVAILRKGISRVDLADEPRIKYFSSATEQEIYKGAFDEPGAKEHVFCFLRSINGLPQDKSARDFIDLDESGKQDTEAHECLTSLKERLRNDLPGNVHEYTDCQWTGNGITTKHLDKLCEDVLAELSGIIKQELATLQKIDPLEQEIADHEAFAEERAKNFTGRVEIQENILAYSKSDSKAPLAIYGEGGSGKSALMAQLFKRIAAENPNAAVVSRFIGATPSSSNIFSLFESLCTQIAGQYGVDASTPTEYKELVEDFKKKLELATKEKPLIIMLDALDQFSDAENAKSLQWLPMELPEHVKVIVSVLKPSECAEQLIKRISEEQPLPVGLMEQQEGEALLDLWLKESNRTLQPLQRQEILNKFRQSGLPLYLKIAFEEARQWKSYIPGEILGSDVQGIILEFLGNLSAESRHGAVLVKHALGYLAAGKNGMTEEEMLDLLSLDQKVKEAFWKRSPNSPKTDRLPVVVWSRLYLDLRPYLTERIADQARVMTFFHRQFGEVVAEKCLAGGDKIQRHTSIANYFAAQPYEIEKTNRLPNFRKISEIAYQMMNGQMWQELQETITDFDYPMTKCKAEMVDELIEDYQKANASPVPDKQAMRIWAAFFRERAHILRRGNKKWPAYKILFQLAVEHADDSPLTKSAEKYLANNQVDWVWLRREQRVKHAGIAPCLAVLEGHVSGVYGAIELRDGSILSWSGDATLRLWNRKGISLNVLEGHKSSVKGALELRDGQILSWADDSTLLLWNKDSGENIVFKRPTYSLLSWSVDGAIELSSGQILSWANDETLSLWNRDGIIVGSLEGHTSKVNGALELSDSRILTWSCDKTLRLWDNNGKPLVVFERHTGRISGAIELSNSRILSWSEGKTLRLWDKDGKRLASLKWHTDWVRGAIELSNGKILSWAGDASLCLWDKNGNFLAQMKKGLPSKQIIEQGYGELIDKDMKNELIELFELEFGDDEPSEGHSLTSRVHGALELSDERILSWANDNNLRLWSNEGTPLKVLEGHTGSVVGALELADGRIISWASDDTLRLWEKEGAPIDTFRGHTDGINGVLDLTSGEILSWSFDHKLRLWDKNVRSVEMLDSHTGRGHGVRELSDGRILSWSADNIPRLWDKDGRQLAVLEGHTDSVNGWHVLSEEQILTWSDDCTLRLWDKKGELLAVLKGHAGCVRGALELADGRILSWADDKTLGLWKSKGEPLMILEGHEGSISGACLLYDDRILSWEYRILRLWDKDGRQLAVLKGHGTGDETTNEINGACELSNGRILSWAFATLRLWNKDGSPLAVLKGHGNKIIGVRELSDGRILSWARDYTLRLWDKDGRSVTVLKGHDSDVNGAFELSNGRILSWAYATLCLWDKKGSPLAVIEKHTDFVVGVRELTDGQILSWARDNTILVLDKNGECIEVISKSKLADLHPKWLPLFEVHDEHETIISDNVFTNSIRAYSINAIQSFVCWSAESKITARLFKSNGILIATQDNGQVSFLKLYDGNHRITLDKLETKLEAEKGGKNQSN